MLRTLLAFATALSASAASANSYGLHAFIDGPLFGYNNVLELKLPSGEVVTPFEATRCSRGDSRAGDFTDLSLELDCWSDDYRLSVNRPSIHQGETPTFTATLQLVGQGEVVMACTRLPLEPDMVAHGRAFHLQCVEARN